MFSTIFQLSNRPIEKKGVYRHRTRGTGRHGLYGLHLRD